MSMPTTISTMLDHQPLHYYLFIIYSQPIHYCLQPFTIIFGSCQISASFR